LIPIDQFLTSEPQRATAQHRQAQANTNEEWLQNDETPSLSSGNRAKLSVADQTA
jgi:hypothetical protein